MLKVRVTFVNNKKGNQELNRLIKEIASNYTILQQSKPYNTRGKGKYSNVYLDVEKR